MRALDTIQYYNHFHHINQALFNPENREKLDFHRLAKYTTWSYETGPDLEFVTPMNASDAASIDDRIDLIFTAAMWQFRKPHVHIGIYNTHPRGEPVTFDI